MIFVSLLTTASSIRALASGSEATYWKLRERTPPLGSCSAAQGNLSAVPLTSIGSSSLQLSWADNGDSSKKFLVKTYGVSDVHPGMLPSPQSLWLRLISTIQCSLRAALAFSKVSKFFNLLPSKKIL